MTDPREELRERVATALRLHGCGEPGHAWAMADAVLDALGLVYVGNWKCDDDAPTDEQLRLHGVPLYAMTAAAAPSGPQEGPADE